MWTLNVQTSSLSEVLARISVLSETGKDCRKEKATLSAMPLKLSDGSDLTFLCRRMLKASSSQDIARIFGALSRTLPTLGFIDSNGNCVIRHGFYPKTGNVFSLSDVLQKNVPATYFLSVRKATCITRAGIARIISRPLFSTVMRGYYKQPNTGNYLVCLKQHENLEGKPIGNQLNRIRMLTEIECERLQGFPDDYTRYGIYGDEKKEIRKCHRYALLGNAVSVPVVAAIAKKIKTTALI